MKVDPQQDPVLTEVDVKGVARLTLNRPQVRNAIDESVITQLGDGVRAFARDSRIRAVILAARGKAFCAGGDLNWMRRSAEASPEENAEEAERLAEVLFILDRLPMPTLALVQGPAYGGGVGLIAACDIVLAAADASFSISEVKLGLIPAVISPYVLAAIGTRQARRYWLTAETFDAEEARRIGLVHRVVAAAELEQAGEETVQALLKNGPRAMAGAKELIRDIARRPLDATLVRETAERLARARTSDEARKRIASFLAKI
jgi:methylglutaconyl-CoA hydratase